MSRHAGITVIEFLIVLVIVVVLAMTLMLPAVNSARRPTLAQDRGKQVGWSELAASRAPLLNDADAERMMQKSGKSIQTADNKDAASPSQKIIYEAEISLVVDKFSETEARITQLLEESGGYVADATVDRKQGEQLSGQWRVRVPVEQFEPFLAAVEKLGVAERRHQTAQDVTAEFVDLGAQIANKKRLEERIVELLKNSPGQIKDVIDVERELARVRGEIEQMEGRLRYLTNRTDFTMVSIAAREEHDYVPPAAPSFASEIRQSWSESLHSLREFGQRTVIATVAAFPWIVVVSILAVPAWCVGRRIVTRRRNAHSDATTVSPQPK